MLAGAVEWTWLGHAMWLVEAGALRLLCDPLLAPTHHGGVFEVVPRRTVHAEALRADFVLVSHRHPDHFDVPSLHRLARIDPDSVVVTPDPLVEWAARELGFRTVRVVPAGQLLELDDVRIVTTPSLAADEWGAMVATDDAVVWNQVDTVLADVEAMRATVAAGLAALGRGAIDLCLARWQPMLEIAAPLGHRTSFPYRDYAGILDHAAAVGARAMVAASCSGAHTGSFGWMDRYVYPIGEGRFARDLAARAPGTSVLPARIGATYRVRGGAVAIATTRLCGSTTSTIRGVGARSRSPR
jgi:UDP-MurNAc hydroxylase